MPKLLGTSYLALDFVLLRINKKKVEKNQSNVFLIPNYFVKNNKKYKIKHKICSFFAYLISFF